MGINSPVRYAAARFAGRIALIENDRQWSFADLDRSVSAIAAGLSARLPPGARVALFMNNRAEYVILQLAIERAGLVRVPINMRNTAHEVGGIVDDCEPSAVFFNSATADRVAALDRPGLWLCDVGGGGGSGGPEWAALLASDPDAGRGFPDMDALSSINYTSGSSGRPKGVMLTHRNWQAVYKNMLIDRDIRSDDVLAHVGPLTHASGTYVTPFLLRGAANVIVGNGALDQLLPTIERFRVTAFSCVPTVLTRVLGSADIDRYDLSSLRWISYGAEAIQRKTLERALARWGSMLTQNYGLTEAMMTCARLGPEEHFTQSNGGDRTIRYDSIGRPYTFVEIALRDPSGEEVPAGQTGEITIRAEHVMQGYWRRPEETAKVLRDGWLWSGDLARRDERGFLYLVGRSKEMLISGGFNIYPAELEACISSYPGVQEVAVVGSADESFGEIAVAFVAAENGKALTQEDCIAYCKPQLGIRTPKQWRFVAALPRTAAGKVDKVRLRDALARGEPL